jgi:hypothetical protein
MTEARYRVVFETDDPRQALWFISLMRRAADRSTTHKDRRFWRALGNKMVAQCQGLDLDGRNQVKRPPDDDEVALRRVINGDGPYPVLSRMDARRVIIHFMDRLSARELGERLYVDHRTVVRWRKEYARGEWAKHGL